MNPRAISRMLHPIKQSVVNMLARAVISAINDAPGIQAAQVSVLEGESRDLVERFQQYGISSVPLPGAEGLVVFLGGNRDHPILTNVDDRRYRPRGLQAGEVIVYTHNGDYVHIKANGTIKVVAETKVEIESPLVQMSGDLRVRGDIIDRYETNNDNVGQMRHTYNIHTHPETNTSNTLVPNQQMDE